MQHSELAAVFSFVILDKVYHFDYLVEKCLFIFTLNIFIEDPAMCLCMAKFFK